MARDGGDRGWGDLGDNTRPFDTTSRYFRQDREDRPVFRPLPRDTRSPARAPRIDRRFYSRWAGR